jgi:predicted phosphodiesterase
LKGRSLSEIAQTVAHLCGSPRGIRILGVSDFHNRIRGFRFAADLCRALHPQLVINTGDLSGIGGPFESWLLRSFLRIHSPYIVALGNHDSRVTISELRRLGAEVLDEPRLTTVGGVRVWGYRDPNRTRLFGAPYTSELCRTSARNIRPPEEARPYVIAVHNELMVEEAPSGVPLVISGHYHSPRVHRQGETLFFRVGSTGGGGPFGGPLHAVVVDLAPTEQVPLAAWLVRVDGTNAEVKPVNV